MAARIWRFSTILTAVRTYPSVACREPHLPRKLRWLSLCFVSSGYANAFMSGSFTAEVVGPELG